MAYYLNGNTYLDTGNTFMLRSYNPILNHWSLVNLKEEGFNRLLDIWSRLYQFREPKSDRYIATLYRSFDPESLREEIIDVEVADGLASFREVWQTTLPPKTVMFRTEITIFPEQLVKMNSYINQIKIEQCQ